MDGILLGLETALQPSNILICLLGVTLGTAVGVLPGIGPTATVALLLPITFEFDAVASLIMLAGIYYGAQYGGSTTAILLNLPGESSSVVTALDGHQMARQGRAGAALATAALGSFFAGTVGTIVLAAFAPPLAELALKFGPADYFAVVVLGLIASVALASGSTVKALAMIVLGLLLGTIGQDQFTGVPRFTFGVRELYGGLDFVSLAVGLFGLAEIIRNLESRQSASIVTRKVEGLWLSRDDFRRIRMPVLRGTALGSVLGVLPGGGALLASFSAYTLEKKVAKPPRNFGRGDIRGVAAPESANNAGAQTSFVPMLTLGIPSNPTMALMIGALMIHGIAPGPRVMTERPELFWGIIASMWIGNLMLVILNLPLVGLWVRFLRIPYRLLFPAIVGFCCIGTYTINSNMFDLFVMAFFALFG
ncbi:MAG TPA: tripartite tricarboxylate transporter permease, partial [Nocardioides sp.]|nr:tripartite tricarboxylate transporter permease [Nocardioides sp.]